MNDYQIKYNQSQRCTHIINNKSEGSMNNIPIQLISDPKLRRIAHILGRPYDERAYEEIHQLSLAFKKRPIQITGILDPKLLSQCVQLLTITTEKQIDINQIVWLQVLKGNFQYHGMPYQESQYLTIEANGSEGLKLGENSIYAVLTSAKLRRAKGETEMRMINEQKKKTKKFIFKDTKIREKDFNIFWESMMIQKVNKNEKIRMKKNDDLIYIIIEGVITIQYNWKRMVKLREISTGAIFSTYLGRYIATKSPKNQTIKKKIDFQYVANSSTIIMAFNPDIFYENQRFTDYRFVVFNAWDTYIERVEQLKKTIERVGAIKPDKSEVIQNIKQKLEEEELRARAISVPVAIEKRKLNKIVLNYFEEKSNRRVVPNLAPKSARTLPATETLQTNNQPEYDVKYVLTPQKSHKRAKTQQVIKPNQSSDLLPVKRFLSTKAINTHSLLFKNNKMIQTVMKSPEKVTMAKFFRPEEFLSRKLRLEYQFISRKTEKLKLPVGNSQHEEQMKNFKTQRQYFEHYINQRRIVKLGPKKRLLYKKRKGF